MTWKRASRIVPPVLLALLACNCGKTAIIVQVDTDLAVGTVSTVRISIVGSPTPVMVPVSGNGAVSFPVALTVVPGTRDDEALDVTVDALDASGNALVTQEVRTSFVPAHTVTAQVMLFARCTGVTCGGTGTCSRAGCTTPEALGANPPLWPQCSVALADCNANPADGCEVDLRSTVSHCGSCTHACAAADACRQGVCDSERVTSVVAGDAFTCAVLQGGPVLCWGANDAGQLGDGTTIDRKVPAPVSGIDAPLSVAAGSEHACAVTMGGALLCWGAGTNGQLANADMANHSTPVMVTGLTPSNVRNAALGRWHTCARLNSGFIWCWGDNSFAQLGDGTRTSRATPMAVPLTIDPTTTQSVAADRDFTCVAHSAGVTCWGNNATGQVDPTTMSTPLPPTTPVTAHDVASISNGEFQACSLFADHTSVCWGGDSVGEVGNGTAIGMSLPLPTATLDGHILLLRAGGYHVCAATDTPAIYCWGQNGTGEVGVSEPAAVLTPSLVLAGTATSIAAGAQHTCVVRDGVVACWGSNSRGQLGDGTTPGRWFPSPVLLFP